MRIKIRNSFVVVFYCDNDIGNVNDNNSYSSNLIITNKNNYYSRYINKSFNKPLPIYIFIVSINY